MTTGMLRSGAYKPARLGGGDWCSKSRTAGVACNKARMGIAMVDDGGRWCASKVVWVNPAGTYGTL